MHWIRTFAFIAAFGIVAPLQAQAYPTKPVRMVVPYPPGGTTDILTRLISQKLTEAWGQQVIVDNRAGASGNIGAEAVVRSPGDGYTLLSASTVHTVNPSLYSKLGYDPLKDFTPITLLAQVANVLVVHPSVPVKSVKELVAFAKKRPGDLLYSSAGNGSAPHLTAELFKTMTGVKMVHVPYKGAAPQMNDVLAGHVALTFATAPSGVPHVRGGRLRALGVSSAARIPALPDVPTIAEAGVPGYESVGWNGLVGPAGLPGAVVDKLNAETVKIMQAPEVVKRLGDLGLETRTSTPAEFAAFLRAEIVKWAKVVKDANVKID